MYIFIIFLFNKDSDLEIYAVAVFVKNKEQDGQMAWRSKLKNYRIIFVFVEMRSLIFEHFGPDDFGQQQYQWSHSSKFYFCL